MADPAALAFLEKVELRGEGDLDTIRALLREALAEGDASLQLSDEERGAAADWFSEHLRQMVVLAEEEEHAAGTAAAGPASTLRTRAQLTPAGASLALHSPLLPPLSPPPADAEVVELEQRVDAQAQRVAELRSSMLPQLQQLVQARLAAFRPTAELEPAEQRQQDGAAAPAGPGSTDVAGQDANAAAVPAGFAGAAEQQAEVADMQQDAQQLGSGGEQQEGGPDAEGQEQQPAAVPLPLSPQPAELQSRLAAAANRMPALRARLEAATDRLQRVVSAVAADINRPPPNTVEKAVLGKTPGRPAAGGSKGEENVPGVSPLFKQALESGQISTRRRAARSPVPYSQPE
ncbi:hypothetical protein C2E21_2304 [Chlorella sorokiniana]|uniref:Uncharacterized protein n=1 Tax=Chlorella sorokiniana TaxID=3076 RepID=A0A2P6TYV9_CHLSO|nr:hypothetical protein C2E21_2304 [Chlorella sorokiniana]|eukprot:PRW59233.1 hypothetical protein C2E21_2304 [Chlorella sorokiniana]